MRLGILSDTHNDLVRTQQAISLLRNEGAEALVHCGDLACSAIVTACAVVPFWFVFGNHDADSVPELELAAQQSRAVCLGWSGTIEIGGKLIGVAHGHMTYDIRRIMALRPNYLLTGHSHIPHDRMDGLVRRINPGALFQADKYTLAILNVEEDELRFLDVES